MSTQEQTGKPSEELARRIVERLVQEQLISDSAARDLQPKLETGKLRGEDWRLPIELGTEKEGER